MIIEQAFNEMTGEVTLTATKRPDQPLTRVVYAVEPCGGASGALYLDGELSAQDGYENGQEECPHKFFLAMLNHQIAKQDRLS